MIFDTFIRKLLLCLAQPVRRWNDSVLRMGRVFVSFAHRSSADLTSLNLCRLFFMMRLRSATPDISPSIIHGVSRLMVIVGAASLEPFLGLYLPASISIVSPTRSSVVSILSEGV